jgi:benzoyl-CoA reductase/2-hydroxyglutaryl-CoA dehydratase subunit BcrC/BadD/HgdB
MLPVVLQETRETVTDGYSRVHPFFCGITRNIIDMAGKGELGFFDGLMYSNICIQNANAALTVKQMLPAGRVAYVQLPTSLTRNGVMADTVRELERVRGILRDMSGREIDDASIETSIRAYNRHRSLLREMHDRCSRNPGLLTFSERQAVVKSGMVMPKEVHTQRLEELLRDLEGHPSGVPGGKRIFLSGHLCQAPRPEIVGLLEEAGGRVVDDDLYTGYRYYARDAETDGGSPLDRLARRYLDPAVPIPTRSDGRIRWDRYLADRARESASDGVVVLLAKYCEPHLFSYPFIRRTLAAAGIPHILIETEHEAMSLEGLRTRLQAFIEML